MKPTSFSQNNMFEQCKRHWYFAYVQKLPAVSDMCYAHGGSVVHTCLERYYSGDLKDTEKLKELFKAEWKKYKLDESKISDKKDLYWLMIINGIALQKNITSTELKIYWPDVVGYIDAVDSENDELLDWKTSTRGEWNEEEYRKQLQLYSWLYYRKFNRLPKKATVHYLKYSGSKGELSFEPTMDDITEIEKWHNDIRTEMEKVIEENKMPEMCESECNIFCPYKNVCFSDENTKKYTLHLMGNYIKIEGEITPLLEAGLKKRYSYELKNAYFIKKNNPHAKTTVEFWNNRRLLPIGFKNALIKTLNDYFDHMNVEGIINIKDHRQFDETLLEMPEKFLNGITLRDYQDAAVFSFLRNDIGILEVATGAGKTEIAIECIRRIKRKTLFIVDRVELMRQTKERIEKALGVEVGIIGSGAEDIKDITVATIQTLVKDPKKYADYFRTVRFVIFDETHKVAANSYHKLATYLINTEHRLGLSGTAFRDDGNDMMINAVTGMKVYDLSAKTLIQNGWLMAPTIQFIKDYMTPEEIIHKEDNCKKGLINETEDYSSYYNEFIVNNEKRNNIIQDYVLNNKNKKVLILTKLIDHGQILQELIPGSKHLYGSTKKKEREEMFEEFSKGELNVLISTISIFAEGIDIPQLDIVINAAANKGNVKTIQVLGRVLRKLVGKENAFYIDFWDDVDFMKQASLARRKALINEGHKVELIAYKDEE